MRLWTNDGVERRLGRGGRWATWYDLEFEKLDCGSMGRRGFGVTNDGTQLADDNEFLDMVISFEFLVLLSPAIERLILFQAAELVLRCECSECNLDTRVTIHCTPPTSPFTSQ